MLHNPFAFAWRCIACLMMHLRPTGSHRICMTSGSACETDLSEGEPCTMTFAIAYARSPSAPRSGTRWGCRWLEFGHGHSPDRLMLRCNQAACPPAHSPTTPR